MCLVQTVTREVGLHKQHGNGWPWGRRPAREPPLQGVGEAKSHELREHLKQNVDFYISHCGQAIEMLCRMRHKEWRMGAEFGGPIVLLDHSQSACDRLFQRQVASCLAIVETSGSRLSMINAATAKLPHQTTRHCAEHLAALL